MPSKSQRIPQKALVLLDLLEPCANQNFKNDLGKLGWESETAVFRALKKLGYETRLFGVCDSIKPLLKTLEEFKPDFVFNLCEAFDGDRGLESRIPALLELLKIPFTGCSSFVLELCKDKLGTKNFLSANGLRTAKHVLVPRGEGHGRARSTRFSKPLRELSFPVLVKPRSLEASVGISQASVAFNEEDCWERVKHLHERFAQDVLIEEFIVGREFYVGMIIGKGGKETIFPPLELRFAEDLGVYQRFASYQAKWSDEYRERWKVQTVAATDLEPFTREYINDFCRKAAEALMIRRGYVRFDLRLTPDGRLVLLEANPNPSLEPQDEFPKAARLAGLSYEKMVGALLGLSEQPVNRQTALSAAREL